jgi:hypothetical protein
MKKLTLAAITLIGAGFFATSGSAMPVNSGVSTFAPESNVIQVNHWKGKHGWKKRRFHRRRHRHHHDHDGFSFGFGFPLFLGLGLASRFDDDDVDCIGRWHRHARRWHCHGQLVYD